MKAPSALKRTRVFEGCPMRCILVAEGAEAQI